jgi:tRNA(adenine34) deaminase
LNILPSDITAFERAIELAEEAQQQGNLPIGAVISYQGNIVAEGKNAIWVPQFNANRHAEIEAMRCVPQHLWRFARELTLVTTLEPCLMCLGAILLYRIGRVLYGAADSYGGACLVAGSLPPYFETARREMILDGPAYPDKCDPLCIRVRELVRQHDSVRQ